MGASGAFDSKAEPPRRRQDARAGDAGRARGICPDLIPDGGDISHLWSAPPPAAAPAPPTTPAKPAEIDAPPSPKTPAAGAGRRRALAEGGGGGAEDCGGGGRADRRPGAPRRARRPPTPSRVPRRPPPERAQRRDAGGEAEAAARGAGERRDGQPAVWLASERSVSPVAPSTSRWQHTLGSGVWGRVGAHQPPHSMGVQAGAPTASRRPSCRRRGRGLADARDESRVRCARPCVWPTRRRAPAGEAIGTPERHDAAEPSRLRGAHAVARGALGASGGGATWARLPSSSPTSRS